MTCPGSTAAIRLGRLLVTLGLVVVVATAQTRPARPGLIRDTDTAEGKDEAAADLPKQYNPMEAEKSLRVGEFYFKRRNYPAAIQRFLEAIEYQPNLIKAYEALGKTYERTGDAEKAKRVYLDFIQRNPDSPKSAEFRSRAARLDKPAS